MRILPTCEIFINGAACIAPAGILPESGLQMRSVEPDYAELIDPKLIRRMSKVVRTGAAAAMAALRDAGVDLPGAIVTGTAYGCSDDTEQFLKRLIGQQEQMLAPTAFIQSTHNTIGAQIGLLLHCHAYNNTIVQRAVSFENSLQDALLLLENGEADNVLAGAADEMPDVVVRVLDRFGMVKTAGAATASPGWVPGEGAAYLLLSRSRSATAKARLLGVETLYEPADPAASLGAFLAACGVSTKDIGLVLAGKNDDTRFDPVYDQVLPPGLPQARFKHVCGEFPVATSFAAWAAVELLNGNNVLQEELPALKGKNILIYNHFCNLYHAFILIGSC